LPSAQKRDELVQKLREKGVNTGGSGEKSLRLRPMLIFLPKHAQLLHSADTP